MYHSKNNYQSNVRKQTLLGVFGFTKTITSKDGKPELVDISKVVKKEKLHTCSISKEKFGNPGALSTHVKCKHGTVDTSAAETINCANKPVRNNVAEEKVPTTFSSTKRAASPEKKKKPNFHHLKKRCISYTAVFKSEVINDHESYLTPSELVKKYSNFRLDEFKV